MKIYIPTRGRASRQITYHALPPELRERTTLVVYPEEEEAYRKSEPTARILVRPVRGIPRTRQFILEQGGKLCMLDDDLSFANRENEKRAQINATSEQTLAMFARLEHWLDEGFTHCGITVRFLNWQHQGFLQNTRMMHCLAYNADEVLRAGCSFTAGITDDKFSMEDFHMTLQLLRAGHSNRVDVDNCVSPSPSNAAGGWSDIRTQETQNASAERLAALHPDFVRVKVKPAWRGMGTERKDVTIQWQKAYKSSQKGA